jgi:hypothetical protein
MKTLGLNPKKLIIALGILFVGTFGLTVLIVTFRYPIKDMKVYVETPTNAPPWVLTAAATNNLIMHAATNNWATQIPFDNATIKFVSETDIAQIKQAIPWQRTILHLYLPRGIVIESSTRAHAEFLRHHAFLIVSLEKKDGFWHADDISSSTWEN